MEPIKPRGRDLTAGKTVIVESNPNKIRRGIIWLDPDVFALTVNYGAKFADEFVILVVKESNDSSFGRANKNNTGPVFDFFAGHSVSA
jgi:hypothetical protein